MRRVVLVALPALLAMPPLLALGGCDLRQLILETELAPAVRDDLVRDCCACLASSVAPLPVDACARDEAPVEPPADAGPAVENACLCGVSADACGDRLIEGGVVDVVGACTNSGGACEEDCGGVLAYP